MQVNCEQRTLRWAWFVTSAPRGEETIDRMLHSLDGAGWPNKETPVFYDAERRGPWPYYQSCLRRMMDSREWTMVLACQDDILLAKNLRLWIEKELLTFFNDTWSDVGVISLYTPMVHSRLPESGWWKLSEFDLPRKAYGACCYVLPRHTVANLLGKPLGHGSRTKIDYWLGKFCKEQRVGYWYHEPSMVQHIGEVSSIDPTGSTHRAKEFRRASYHVADAREWLRG